MDRNLTSFGGMGHISIHVQYGQAGFTEVGPVIRYSPSWSSLPVGGVQRCTSNNTHSPGAMQRTCIEVIQRPFTINTEGRQPNQEQFPTASREQVLAELTAPVRRGSLIPKQEDVQKSCDPTLSLLIWKLSLLLVVSLPGHYPIGAKSGSQCPK